MADTFDYLLTAVWFDDYTKRENVTHALIHKLTGTSVAKGEKKSKAEILKLISESKICTAIWNYSAGQWALGSIVKSEVINGVTYLRSKPDNTTEDNLKHLLWGGNIHS